MFTMLELVEKVIELTTSKSKIVHYPLPGDDPKQRRPEISLAKDMADGWELMVRLEDGLKMAIEYFRKLYN